MQQKEAFFSALIANTLLLWAQPDTLAWPHTRYAHTELFLRKEPHYSYNARPLSIQALYVYYLVLDGSENILQNFHNIAKKALHLLKVFMRQIGDGNCKWSPA